MFLPTAANVFRRRRAGDAVGALDGGRSSPFGDWVWQNKPAHKFLVGATICVVFFVVCVLRGCLLMWRERARVRALCVHGGALSFVCNCKHLGLQKQQHSVQHTLRCWCFNPLSPAPWRRAARAQLRIIWTLAEWHLCRLFVCFCVFDVVTCVCANVGSWYTCWYKSACAGAQALFDACVCRCCQTIFNCSLRARKCKQKSVWMWRTSAARRGKKRRRKK